MEKKDYTYIGTLDKVSTEQVIAIQNKLKQALGYSEYADQWIPHVTVSFGNMLSLDEVGSVVSELTEALKEVKSTPLEISGVVTHDKVVQGEAYTAIRLKLVPTSDLDILSQKVIAVAKKYEIPFDAFTDDHFHIGIGRYSSEKLQGKDVASLIPFQEMRPIVDCVSVYYSMMNKPKPERAHEMASINLL